MHSILSQLLIAEHNVILSAGEFMSSKKNLWESNPVEYEKKISELLEFFSVYADEYHHLKEEEILFPAISKKNEIAPAGIVQELLEHHENFRTLIQQIRTSLVAKEFAETQNYLDTYISLLKDHIAVENDELFPMADDIFSADELEKLYHKCIDKDTELGLSQKEKLELEYNSIN